MRIFEQSLRSGSPNPRKHVALLRNTLLQVFQVSDSAQNFD
jgi:hypothetical protein